MKILEIFKNVKLRGIFIDIHQFKAKNREILLIKAL
jgi:hypothetical protein